MPHSEKYNIILIEPSPVIQLGLKTMLGADPRFVVSHSFNDYQTYENSFLKDQFQLVLINPQVISSYSQFSVKNLFRKYPDTLLVAIVYNYILPDILEGFDGAIDIYSPSSQLIRKLIEILENTDIDTSRSAVDDAGLSDREKEILISVAIGLSNKEIAEKHNISVHTVISHRKNITRKIGIRSASGLTIYAIFNNLITENDLK